MLKRFLTLLVLVSLPCSAIANMFVDRSIIEFVASDGRQQDLRVSNRGNDQMYVQIEVLDVQNPGADNEQRVTLTDLSEMSLLATPKQFVLPAQGERAIRLVSLQEASDVERIYRVNVTPVLPPLADNEASVVRVVVAYQLLVIVQPVNPIEDLFVERRGDVMYFENRGNSYVLLAEGEQCSSSECEDVPTRRLYAGNSWELPLSDAQASVNFRMSTFQGSREVTF